VGNPDTTTRKLRHGVPSHQVPGHRGGHPRLPKPRPALGEIGIVAIRWGLGASDPSPGAAVDGATIRRHLVAEGRAAGRPKPVRRRSGVGDACWAWSLRPPRCSRSRRACAPSGGRGALPPHQNTPRDRVRSSPRPTKHTCHWDRGTPPSSRSAQDQMWRNLHRGGCGAALRPAANLPSRATAAAAPVRRRSAFLLPSAPGGHREPRHTSMPKRRIAAARCSRAARMP